MRDEDLERIHDLCKRDTLVFSPLSDIFCAVDKNYEVVIFALEVDSGLGSFAASHGNLCAERRGIV